MERGALDLEHLWLPFTAPSTIPNVGDFRFSVHEGSNSVAADDGLNILSFVYIEPWDYWLSLGDFPTQPTYADALARLTDQAAGNAPPSRVDRARSTFVAGHQDPGSTFLHQILNVPASPNFRGYP